MLPLAEREAAGPSLAELLRHTSAPAGVRCLALRLPGAGDCNPHCGLPGVDQPKRWLVKVGEKG